MEKRGEDIFHACCCNADVKVDGTKMYDPMLKLHLGCPVMINDNIDVEKNQ